MLDLSDMLLVAITIWAVITWGIALIKDILKYKNRGKCIIEAESGYNYYHFLGIVYIIIVYGLRKAGFTGHVREIITAGFLTVSCICVYRAIRTQGLYENGLCIPEQNCDLTAIKYYKWVGFTGDSEYVALYLKVAYQNMLTRYGAKVIKLKVPIKEKASIQALLKGIEGCKEA